MQLLGGSAVGGQSVLEAVGECAFAGRPCFLWCDGEALTVVLGDEGESAGDVLGWVAKVTHEA